MIERVFEIGVDQLQSLTSEEANRIVSEIRRIVEPTVNHQMEELEIPFSLAIPGLGKLNLTVKGHRVSVQRFQERMLRFIIGSVLWLSAFAGTAHWVMWTIFGTRYLAVEFEDPAKFVQLVLLLPATLFAWVVGRNGGPQFVRQERKLVRASLRTSIGLLIAGAWVYWFVWVFDGLGEWVVLEATTKIVQPLFLLSGFVAVWLVGRLSTEAATMEAGQSNVGKLNLTVKGRRVSVQRFQERMLRFIIGSVLWLSAFAGTAHWVMWTIFGTRYLAVEFEDPAKFVQLVLLLPATLFAWVVGRNGGPQFVRQERKLVRASLRTSIGLLIAGAWVYWFVWVFDGLGEWVVLEATTKIVQPLFLLSGFFAAWLVGRPSTEAATMEAGQSNGGVS